MFDMIKELCLLNGISGREDDVRNYITDKVKTFANCKYYVDALGNVIVEKEGKLPSKNRIMLDAHMDEVGFIVTDITDDGFIKFDCVGGIDNSILPAKRVRIGDTFGVIGVKPVHLLSKDESKKVIDIENLYIDIGSSCKAKTLDKVSIGESIYFESEYYEFGDGFIKSKALDDRFGCAMLLKLLEDDTDEGFVCTFSTQEEIGTRGAAVLCTQVKPDRAIVIETTTACDLDGVSHDKQVCNLGDGPVVSFMDRGTVYERDMFNKAFEIAKKNGIKCQTKRLIAGGNNSSAIHKSYVGVKTVAVSLACRYLHSPSCVIKKTDVDEIYRLLKLMIKEYSND